MTMATASLMKANQLMLSKRRQNFNGNVTSTSPRFSSVVKVQSFGNLTSDAATSRNNAAAAVPFSLKAQFKISSTNVSPLKKPVIYNIFETVNFLKVPAIVMVHSMLLLLMMMNRGGHALACTSPSIGRHVEVFKENREIESWLQNLSTRSGREIVKGDTEPTGEPRSFKENMVILLMLFPIPIYLILDERFGESRIKVIKLQVALSVPGPRLIFSLNSTAKSGDTSTSDGLKDLLLDMAGLLFDNSMYYWMAAYTSVRVRKSMEDAQKAFKKLEIEERGKFDEDFVDLNKDKKRSDIYDFNRKNHVVVTFLVVGKGKGFHGFPNFIVDKKDLRKALKQLQIISEFGEIQAISIWSTPREEKRILPLKDIKENYPLLRMFPRGD